MEAPAHLGPPLCSTKAGKGNSAASQPAISQPAASEKADAAKPINEKSATDNSSVTKDEKNANAHDEKKDDEEQSNDEDQSADTDDNADEGDQSPDETQPATDQQAVEMTPEIDAGFAQLARERIARAPFHYYVWLPMKRAVAMWFDTHSNYYPFEGELFPLEDLDHDTHQHIWLPLFASLVWIHTLLALAGAILLWLKRDGASRRWLLLAVLMTLPRLKRPEMRSVRPIAAANNPLSGRSSTHAPESNPVASHQMIVRLRVCALKA